jgi:hypothetical protein
MLILMGEVRRAILHRGDADVGTVRMLLLLMEALCSRFPSSFGRSERMGFSTPTWLGLLQQVVLVTLADIPPRNPLIATSAQ